ncbi:uncharacterized protein LOC113209227 [Frankliniella occidentalis]|uniref:Uncharacterized protein LOC113209227 n=1 Tax=Frankliniella occidentalis TaxID=133901 RepID=A0A6J1SMB2_FRAOC|nr:uncharacterized protein LOC113209227 [Frankliniella occidentalis]
MPRKKKSVGTKLMEKRMYGRRARASRQALETEEEGVQRRARAAEHTRAWRERVLAQRAAELEEARAQRWCEQAAEAAARLQPRPLALRPVLAVQVDDDEGLGEEPTGGEADEDQPGPVKDPFSGRALEGLTVEVDIEEAGVKEEEEEDEDAYPGLTTDGVPQFLHPVVPDVQTQILSPCSPDLLRFPSRPEIPEKYRKNLLKNTPPYPPPPGGHLEWCKDLRQWIKVIPKTFTLRCPLSKSSAGN